MSTLDVLREDPKLVEEEKVEEVEVVVEVVEEVSEDEGRYGTFFDLKKEIDPECSSA